MSMPTPEPARAASPRTRASDRAAGRVRQFPLRPARRSAIHNPQSTIHNPHCGRRSAAPPTRSSVPAGFTLLEAIVALTIFSAGALTLYGLFNTNLGALQRVHDATAHLPAAQRALAHLSAIDPRRHEEGRLEFDAYSVVWSARLLEPARKGQSPYGRMGDYEIGLYRIEFSLSERGRPVGTYRLRRIGYERVRESGGTPGRLEPL